jgi:hypothetical protein
MRRASVGRLGVTMAQMGLFDLLDRYASLDAKRDPLVEFDAVVPWEEFRPMQERIWRKPEAEHKSRARRKPMDAVLMFKMMVLGRSTICRTTRSSISCATVCRSGRFLGL